MLEKTLAYLLENIGPFALSAILLILVLVLGFVLGTMIQKAKLHSVIKKERADAVKKSRAVLGGQFGEQLAPYLPGFPCNPGDVQFIGSPVDYVAFPGYALGKEIKEVVFIEVKSGQSTLSARERQIRDAVRAGRVRYLEYRLPESS
ncbi:MAG: Holliday junction resolvase [Treponema sp.]|nr:Holliday junction resolvase [Treponema sp.]